MTECMHGVPYSSASVWGLCFHSVSENNGAETDPYENDSYIYPAFYHIDTRHIPQQHFCHSWHTYQRHRLFSQTWGKRERKQSTTENNDITEGERDEGPRLEGVM